MTAHVALAHGKTTLIRLALFVQVKLYYLRLEGLVQEVFCVLVG